MKEFVGISHIPEDATEVGLIFREMQNGFVFVERVKVVGCRREWRRFGCPRDHDTGIP